MKQGIKNNKLQGRTKYVPASVKVIEVAAQRVLCGSGDMLGEYQGNSWDENPA